MLAVIKSGGKQDLVQPGDKIKIEKIKNKPGSGKNLDEIREGKEITFPEVLLVEKNRKLQIGTPLVKGAKVIGKILSQGKGKKTIVFKYKPKTRYKKKKSHRQPFIEVEIMKIEV